MRRPALFVITGLVVVSLAGNVLYQRALARTRERYREIAQSMMLLPSQVLASPAPSLPAAAEPTFALPGPAAAAPAADVAAAAEPANATAAAQPSAPAAEARTTVAASPPPVVAAGTGAAKADPLGAIRVKYSPRIQEIQTDCETRVDTLLGEAKTEYDRQRASGSADLAALFGKYGPELDSLRRICDGRVNALLTDLSGDLKAASLPQDLVGEVRKAYQTRVAEMQAQILAQVQ